MEDDCSLFDVTCQITSVATNSMVEVLRGGAEWVVTTTFGWWVRVDPISIAGSSAASEIRGYLLPLALLVAVGGVMWQGARMAATRKAAPLVDALRGLVMLALFSAGGIYIVDRGLAAADGFANWVLDRAGDGAGVDRLSTVLALETITNPGAVLIMSLLVMLAGLLQAMVMLLREAALVILAGVLVLAAAGQATGATRPWLAKVGGWSLALIFYKPAAALVYSAALALMGDVDDPRTVMVGVMMMVLSLVALPALMKFFTWAVPAGMGAGGGMAAGLAGAAGVAAAAGYGMHATSAGGFAGAQAQAAAIRSDLGPSNGGGGASSGPAPVPVGAAAVGAPAPAVGAAGGGAGAGATGAAGAAGTAGAASTAGPAAAAVSVASGAKQVADGAAGSLANDPGGR